MGGSQPVHSREKVGGRPGSKVWRVGGLGSIPTEMAWRSAKVCAALHVQWRAVVLGHRKRHARESALFGAWHLKAQPARVNEIWTSRTYRSRRNESLNPCHGWAFSDVRYPLKRGETSADHSHSIVAGGFPEMSYTTRLMPRTSLMMRFETRPSRSCGRCAQCAVMKSWVCTARSATTYS